jgi:hypothetical protein
MQKTKYENSILSPFKNIIFKKSSTKNQNPSKYYNPIINSSFNTSQNIDLHKSSYKNRLVTLGPKYVKLLYFIMNVNTTSLPWSNVMSLSMASYMTTDYEHDNHAF